MTPAKRPIGPPGVPEGSGRASLLFPGRSLDRRGASGGTAPQEAPRLRRHRAAPLRAPSRRGDPARPHANRQAGLLLLGAPRLRERLSGQAGHDGAEDSGRDQISARDGAPRPARPLPLPLTTDPNPDPNLNPDPDPDQARPPGQTSCNTMKELVQELCKALELQVRVRARLRRTRAALHRTLCTRTARALDALHAHRRTARAPHAYRTRTARAPQELKYLNPANEIGDQALKDFDKWQRKVKGMTPPKSRSMWKTATQRRRPIRPPARPASARSSSGRPPASASSLGQPRPICSGWQAGLTGLAFHTGRASRDK